jgi:hypothetical protein
MYQSAKSLYQQCESQRFNFLDRGREAAKLTIPHLLPPEGFHPTSRLETPYQGIGARGVNNLSSKLLLALFPANAPFFRLTMDQSELNKMEEEMQEDAQGLRTELDRALAKIERSTTQSMEVEAYRVGLYECLRHLVVSGNALIYLPEQGGLRVFHLDRFVVKRDPMGNVTHIVVLETVAPTELPEEVRGEIKMESNEKTCDLYTAVVKQPDGKYKVWQEVKGVVLPESVGEYKEENLEWIPLRWSRIDGESYGRGFVEEYLGDLISLNGLSRAILEGSVAAAKLLFLVNPNGSTEIDEITDAPNGAVINGNREEIGTLQADKFNDFRVAQETMFKIEERLAHAFLLNSNVVRQAERVTAEEIRMLSQELEATLGGLYSLLSQELQLPLVTKTLNRLVKTKKIPKLPEGVVRPAITTGVDALGRGNDLNRLDLFLGGAQQVVGPQAIAQYVSVGEYFKRRATSLGVDPEGLVKTDEQIQQEMQQAQMAQMAQQLGPNAIKTASDQFMQQEQLAAQSE